MKLVARLTCELLFVVFVALAWADISSKANSNLEKLTITSGVLSTSSGAPASASCKTTVVNAQGVANAGIAVDATAGGVTVLAASATRCDALITNQGSGDMLCGPSTITVTTTVGFYVPAGGMLALGDAGQQAWKCIRQAAVSTTAYVAEAKP